MPTLIIQLIHNILTKTNEVQVNGMVVLFMAVSIESMDKNMTTTKHTRTIK